MAAPAFLDDLEVWVDGQDITGTLNRANLSLSKAELTNNRFSDSVDPVFPGLVSVNLDLGGFFDASDDGDSPI